MYEPTREQESKIAAMALEHGSVAVAIDEASDNVKATAGGHTWLIGDDGDAVKAPPEHATVNIPTELLRALLGPEYVGHEIDKLDEADAFPEHTLGRAVRDSLIKQLRESMAV